MKAAELRAQALASVEAWDRGFAGDMNNRARFISPAIERERAILAALDDAAIPRWRPIETAPAGEWVNVWGVRFGDSEPCACLAKLDAYGWGERCGGAVEPTHWSPIPTEAL